MKALNYIMYAFMACSLAACTSGNTSHEEAEETEEGLTDVTLTDAQVKQLKVMVGKMPQHSFAGEIEANGTVAIMPQSEALVSSFIGANVKSIAVKAGQKVCRGQALAYVSHPDLLDIQSRYLTAYNRLAYVQQEYERQQKLYSEKIASGKDYQQTKSEYQSLKAELQTTAAQLQMLGVNLQSLRSSHTVTAVAVTSPIEGSVEEINVKTGQYVDSQTPMFRIINTKNVYADLQVFEKDAPFVKVGQSVTLTLKSSTGKTFMGKVASVGQTFEGDTKAVHLRVSIDGSHEGLVPGMYLCGHVAADSQLLQAMSTEGVVDESGNSYIFSARHSQGKWTFHPIEVKRGREEKGYVEIASAISSDATLALDNAYYIMSEMKKGETGED